MARFSDRFVTLRETSVIKVVHQTSSHPLTIKQHYVNLDSVLGRELSKMLRNIYKLI